MPLYNRVLFATTPTAEALGAFDALFYVDPANTNPKAPIEYCVEDLATMGYWFCCCDMWLGAVAGVLWCAV
jgi:hypothetical protein